MKKKTVITTEKREMWIVRHPSDDASSTDATEHGADNAGSAPSSISIPSNGLMETDTLTEEQN